MSRMPSRSGRYVRQPAGYRAFIPTRLLPEPPVELNTDDQALLSAADQAIGRLDGISRFIANPEMFVTMSVRREAVLSSRIEGTRSSLNDVLSFEVDDDRRNLPDDVVEVVGYVRALRHGLVRLEELPLSLRLIRELHAEMMDGPHGIGMTPGEFRTTQNWIGRPGATLADASFVPPPPAEMWSALDDLERFLHNPGSIPTLVHVGIVHAQFEMIHPFLDGNGRVGRLLITFLLRHHGVLQLPVLYLSKFLNTYRSEYYALLAGIQNDGDWEGWIRFFLRGVHSTADDAIAVIRAAVDLREQHLELVQNRRPGVNAVRLLDLLFQQPVLDARWAAARLGVSFQTASTLLSQFEQLGLLAETTGGRRNRQFRYDPYLQLFDDDRAAGDVDQRS